jgi:hypothetical protein
MNSKGIVKVELSAAANFTVAPLDLLTILPEQKPPMHHAGTVSRS